MSFSPSRIISGGQSGVDRAALDFALKKKIPYGGFLPKGRWAEDGPLDKKYQNMTETDSVDPADRTRLNVVSAEVVLVISRGKPDGGTKLTIALAKQNAKSLMRIDLVQADLFHDDLLQRCNAFVRGKATLIAGPRESKCPGIYEETLAFLEQVATL